MTRVVALSSVLGEPVTSELVHRALGDRATSDGPGIELADGAPSLEAIQEATCDVCGVSRADLLSPKRTSRVTHARQLAIYLTRDLTTLSLAQIARGFNRDHSTVLHATRAVSRRLEVNSETATLLDQTRGLLQRSHPTSSDIPGDSHHPGVPPQPTSTAGKPHPHS